jgi:hypothetical protein
MFLKNCYLALFLVLEVLLGLAFGVLAGFLVYSDALPLGYYFIAIASLFLFVGLGGFLARSRTAFSVWTVIALAHLLVQVHAALLSLTISFFCFQHMTYIYFASSCHCLQLALLAVFIWWFDSLIETMQENDGEGIPSDVISMGFDFLADYRTYLIAAIGVNAGLEFFAVVFATISVVKRRERRIARPRETSYSV